MPKRIILLRHGQSDFNREKIIQGQLDTFLDKEGLKQARQVASFLSKRKIDVIFSSDLKRAYYTALTVAHVLKNR